MDKKQTFLFLAQRSDLRSKFRWFQTSGFLETLKPAERWICPKYSEVTLQLHTAFRIGKHHCLSLNLNFHRINCKCLISLNTHQNQINPYLHFKDVFLFPVFILNRWFHGATAGPFTAGLQRSICELMSTKPKPEASRGTRQPDHNPTGPATSKNTTSQCSSQFMLFSQPCITTGYKNWDTV